MEICSIGPLTIATRHPNWHDNRFEATGILNNRWRCTTMHSMQLSGKLTYETNLIAPIRCIWIIILQKSLPSSIHKLLLPHINFHWPWQLGEILAASGMYPCRRECGTETTIPKLDARFGRAWITQTAEAQVRHGIFPEPDWQRQRRSSMMPSACKCRES